MFKQHDIAAPWRIHAARLLDEFENHIEDLKLLDERIQRRVEKLEQQCHKEAKEFAHKVQDLQRSNQVCHLGDQLEGVNTPRQRAVEAQRLMTYFNEFLDGELRSDVFNNPDKASSGKGAREGSCAVVAGWTAGDSEDIKEAADIIQKLHLIAQELPFDRFADVKAKIASKYHDLERQLIQEFTSAQRRGEIARMRQAAAVLLHFKGYAHCVDVYIKQCQEVGV
ncbi:Exocyst complex component 5 [Acipenser ruthenus]|uniref:Exocyst complex component 5 n=1 Tax=Acipenser ruthenus TaxID=7906 RepID=A0A662YPC9_ACIRT|nr:Exocyst complex component 5 [Acipenser ruthenus]